MIEAYDKYKTYILGIQEVAKVYVCNYGIAYVKQVEDRVHRVKGLVEK